MCKTVEELSTKIKELKGTLTSLENELKLLKSSQCLSCQQRMREKNKDPEEERVQW